MGERLYTYADLYIHGHDKDVFEVAQSPIHAYNGERFVIKQHTNGKVIKENGRYHDDSRETLMVPHAGYTGAKYRKVEIFESTDVLTALHYIKTGVKEVYYKLHGEFQSIDKYTDFENRGLIDLDDLFKLEFYVKK